MADSAPAGSLYLLDAHGLIFQMFYGVGAMSAPDGRPTNAVFGVTRSLMNLYDRGADYLIATLDHKEKTFRDAIDVNYKAHRQPPPDDLLVQEPMIQQIMEAMHIPFLVVPGFEADDIMATIAEQAAARGLDVFLCTADKDCRQLVSDRVKILNLRKPEGELLDAAVHREGLGRAAGAGRGLPVARRRLGGQRPRRARRRAEDGGQVAAAVRHARQPHRPRGRGARRAEDAAGAQGRHRQRQARQEQDSS